jgi:hypothetical protein
MDVAPHGVHRREGSQRLQRGWIVYIASMHDQVYSGERIEYCIWHPLQAMRDVGIGEQTDSEGRHNPAACSLAQLLHSRNRFADFHAVTGQWVLVRMASAGDRVLSQGFRVTAGR